jgi:hypothetical protein
MATLTFEGETHGEIVAKVRRWLASVDGEDVAADPVEVIERGAELAKDALRVIASAAPGPVADSEVVKGLTAMGYQVTDAAKDAVVDALDAMSRVSGGSFVERVQRSGQSALFQMNGAIAKQVLKSLRPK